jgi:hypothetical protein
LVDSVKLFYTVGAYKLNPFNFIDGRQCTTYDRHTCSIFWSVWSNWTGLEWCIHFIIPNFFFIKCGAISSFQFIWCQFCSTKILIRYCLFLSIKCELIYPSSVNWSAPRLPHFAPFQFQTFSINKEVCLVCKTHQNSANSSFLSSLSVIFISIFSFMFY